MNFDLPAFRRDEAVSLKLRAALERRGYELYRAGSFEEYDTYLKHNEFLNRGDVITFTSPDGRLMAMKPDITLSIVKNSPPGEQRRVYYNESVFRRDRRTGEYREIKQMGLEFIGGEGEDADAEALSLAAQSLDIIGDGALDLSHTGFVDMALSRFSGEWRRCALDALSSKSPHAMREAARAFGLDAKTENALARLAALSGPAENAFAEARDIAAELSCGVEPLDELEALFQRCKDGAKTRFRLDFSIRGDADYYSGLIFQGFVNGASRAALTGGRYDNLTLRFGKRRGAVGFALYLDEIGRDERGRDDGFLNVALPKGRLGGHAYKLFEKAGLGCDGVFGESRKLVFEDKEGKTRYFLVKPSDVGSYVEHGAADIGVAGKDMLLENGSDVIELLDMGFGKCRLVAAGLQSFKEDPALPLRVATKYPSVARAYYAALSRDVDIIKLNGSIEIAPIVDLADVIVDIVETGHTLKENNLTVFGEIVASSARLIANRASWRFKNDAISALTRKLEGLS
ncbi:MAG: ATP phosphoribosyltransferase [Clostridiales bacterium]|jgi:ATP phosphoribosyltransferase regulatory subunit|nr:ATP phosphoribosyltransferase [Clostridiales bacterium]